MFKCLSTKYKDEGGYPGGGEGGGTKIVYWENTLKPNLTYFVS